MTRPDLHGNYSGWQALDATPQEISDFSGTMVTGPASIRAIKEGKDLQYDNLFVMSEVNADVLYHIEKNGKSVVVGSDTTRVGSFVATKKVGKDELEDITLEYKYEEGSLEERATASTRPTTDVKFKLSTEQSVAIGKPCTFTLTMQTVASGSMTVDLVMKANSVTYIGSVGALLKEMKTSKTVSRGSEGVYFRMYPCTSTCIHTHERIRAHSTKQSLRQPYQAQLLPAIDQQWFHLQALLAR